MKIISNETVTKSGRLQAIEQRQSSQFEWQSMDSANKMNRADEKER